MIYSVSPVIRISVNDKNPSDLPELVSGLQKMPKADPFIQVINTEIEHIICGSGKLHLEICLNDLVDDYANIEINISNPIVSYKEIVTTKSSQIYMAISPYKYNRLYVIAEPLSEYLVKEIEDGNKKPSDDYKVTAKTLIDNYVWDQHDADAKKVCLFDPDQIGPNLLID